MKLREAAKSILAGMDVAQPMEDSEKASPDRGNFSDYCAQLMGNTTSHRDLKIY